jgi:ribosomal protein L40E
MSKETTTCPFCFNKVPWGATVCRGCNAVLKYGASEK